MKILILLSFSGLMINVQDQDFLSLAENILAKPSPTLVKIKEEINRSISEAPRFPMPGTYISYEGKNNAFKWVTTIKENGSFTATVAFEKKSASGDGQWKVESGKFYIRWKNIPDFLEPVPGAPEWVDMTEIFKSNRPVSTK